MWGKQSAQRAFFDPFAEVVEQQRVNAKQAEKCFFSDRLPSCPIQLTFPTTNDQRPTTNDQRPTIANLTRLEKNTMYLADANLCDCASLNDAHLRAGSSGPSVVGAATPYLGSLRVGRANSWPEFAVTSPVAYGKLAGLRPMSARYTPVCHWGVACLHQHS